MVTSLPGNNGYTDVEVTIIVSAFDSDTQSTTDFSYKHKRFEADSYETTGFQIINVRLPVHTSFIIQVIVLKVFQ